jgi:hypothetical protein
VIGGFALGLILGLAMGVCLYREAYEYFRLKDAQEQKHQEHLERVREWERRQKAGIVWGQIR